MSPLRSHPADLPSELRGVPERVAARLGIELQDGGALPDPPGDDDPWVVFVDAVVQAGGPGAAIEEIRALVDRPGISAVLIVGDGYLGTDAADTSTSLAGAAAISLMRSVASRRSGGGRVNVVCVPERMFGVESSRRAPLRTATEAADVAEAAAMFLSEEGRYLRGQALFVDGGRHLFSSMSA